MRVLESFLISLGLQVDERSFRNADAALNGLTRSALQMGAVFASKLAIDKVVGDFKNAGTALDNFNRLTGISTQTVQTLGQALTAQGGSANDAFDALKKIQDLMASQITGNVSWFGDVAKLGLDPNAVIKAESTADALANIAESFEKMTPLNQRLAGEALGLDENTVRLLMRGRAEVEKQLDARGKLGVMTQQQVSDAARLTKATSELNLVFTDMGNTIAGELAPALADMAEDFVSFYRANKDLVDSGLEKFFGALAENIQLVAVGLALMSGAGALNGIIALRSIIGLGGGPGRPPGAPPAGGPGKPPLLPLLVNPTTAGIAALTYAPSLNENEDKDLLNKHVAEGGAPAAESIINFFRSKGWTDDQAKGITANLQQESGFRHDIEGDGGNAYGMAQWHKDRQDNFKKFADKSIRESTAAEQLEFIHYELTQGAEKSAGRRLRMTSNAYDAASSVSQYYERPADREGEAQRRGQLAQSYSSPASAAPELTQAQVDKMLGRASYLEHTNALLGSQRKPLDNEPVAGGSEWQKIQREAPRNYSVNSVVQDPPSPPAPQQSAGVVPQQPASIQDNRQFHIHGADTEKVKQLYNEQLSRMTDQALDAFRSPEK